MPNAVIVAGHAVLRDVLQCERDEGWFLLDFQRNEPRCYLEHIRAGVEHAAANPDSLLLFSGGASRAIAGPRTEALGYWLAAQHLAWFGSPEVERRALLEEFARDSFENLLFGIARFREYTGEWPGHVTLASWRFKEERFHLHRQAIRWPSDRFTYLGVNNPQALDQALEAEARARQMYSADPYSSTPFYQAKRVERNVLRRQHGYDRSTPELSALFRHAGPERFPGPLPWD